jgi:hypothetical protein
VAAVAADKADTISSPITVILSCIDVTSITSTYIDNNNVQFVVAYTTDGAKFKILVPSASVTETVDIL